MESLRHEGRVDRRWAAQALATSFRPRDLGFEGFDDKANSLLAGTFHEIGSAIQILDLDHVHRLSSPKREWRGLEEELRLA